MTKNFKKIEFESKDGSKMPMHIYENVMSLAHNLQKIRDYIGKPIHINSAYRSPSHNRRQNGTKNSLHLLGLAADITVRDMSPKKLARVIIKLIKQGKIPEGGIGLYNGFVHYDIRGHRARWDYSSWFNF